MKAEVVVLGAGAAGVACAHRLHQAGHDVLLLEARDRIGNTTGPMIASHEALIPTSGLAVSRHRGHF